jgi:hypothetical protein
MTEHLDAESIGDELVHKQDDSPPDLQRDVGANSRKVYNQIMNREAVIAALREHEPELKAAGIVRLSLFGSTARGEARPDSDIDLLATFDDTRPLSLLDVIRIENRLADLLGQPVDLLEEGTLKPRVQQNVDREAERAF